MTGSIRLARIADLPALGVIERTAQQLFVDAGIEIGTTAASSDDVEEYTQAIANGDLWVAVDPEDRCLGFVVVEWFDGAAYIEELDVHPDHHRRGIGRALAERDEAVLGSIIGKAPLRCCSPVYRGRLRKWPLLASPDCRKCPKPAR